LKTPLDGACSEGPDTALGVGLARLDGALGEEAIDARVGTIRAGALGRRPAFSWPVLAEVSEPCKGVSDIRRVSLGVGEYRYSDEVPGGIYNRLGTVTAGWENGSLNAVKGK